MMLTEKEYHVRHEANNELSVIYNIVSHMLNTMLFMNIIVILNTDANLLLYMPFLHLH